MVINNKTLKKININDNLIYRFSLDQIPLNNHDQIRGKWGIFLNQKLSRYLTLTNFINEKYQTLTYFGIDKKLQNFIIKNKLVECEIELCLWKLYEFKLNLGWL